MSYYRQKGRIDLSSLENIYYIAIIRNFLNSTITEIQQLTFIEQHNISIIENYDEYLMSIMRFNIDTLILPVFFCIVQLNQSDLNLSIYSITLEYDDKDSTTTVGPYYIE